MDQFEHLNVAQLQALQQETVVQIVDIRDQQSFAQGHIPDAFHLTNESLVELMNEVAFETPLIVVCYHGISSQGAAQYLFNQGYEQVYSLDGGYEAWQAIQAAESN